VTNQGRRVLRPDSSAQSSFNLQKRDLEVSEVECISEIECLGKWNGCIWRNVTIQHWICQVPLAVSVTKLNCVQARMLVWAEFLAMVSTSF
jgi:hypothetical protein